MKIIRKGVREIQRITGVLRDVERTHAEIGFQSTARYPDGTPIAYIAAVHEYGTLDRSGHVPPRPFMRPTIDERHKEWADDLKRGVVAAVAGRLTYTQVLEQVSQKAAGQVRRTISRITEPPLAEGTVKAKGHAKPLVATGLMLQSVSSKVVKK